MPLVKLELICIGTKPICHNNKHAFRQQIQLAKQYKLPIVIHCREAFDEIFEILEEEKSTDLFGIFHCFSEIMSKPNRAIS